MSDSNQALFSCERTCVAHDRQRVIAIGEIDLATGPHLRGVLREAQTYARHVVLDLGQTTFIDAGGARILLAARAQAHATAATFEIVRSTSPVRRLLDLVGANAILHFPPSERERVTVRVPASPSPARDRPSPLLR